MIVFIYGTTAEAIKIAPVVSRLTGAGATIEHWLTYQHTDALDRSRSELGFPPADQVIARGAGGKAIQKPAQLLRWLGSVIWWTLRNLASQRRRLDRKHDLMVVHGDTVTTVVGAILAKLYGVRCAHIEAGLRSGDWRNPFPEELDRRIVGKLADIHYAPSQAAVEHLGRRPGVVWTHGNTVIDAVDDLGEDPTKGEPYGLVLLHRFELINEPSRVEEIFSLLAEHTPVPLLVLVDAYAAGPVTAAVQLADVPELLKLTPKLPYSRFIQALRGAEFIVTDSGGIQAEAAHCGVPTLVHRVAIEQEEGLGRNVLLSEWNPTVVAGFLSNHGSYRRDPNPNAKSPSQIIVADLAARGYLGDSK